MLLCGALVHLQQGMNNKDNKPPRKWILRDGNWTHSADIRASHFLLVECYLCYRSAAHDAADGWHCVPAGERLLFVGDSTMRYQYLGLVSALARGREWTADGPSLFSTRGHSAAGRASCTKRPPSSRRTVTVKGRRHPRPSWRNGNIKRRNCRSGSGLTRSHRLSVPSTVPSNPR